MGEGSTGLVSTLVLDFIGTAFTGTLKVVGRIVGGGAAGVAYGRALAITNRKTGAVVDGSTGITDPDGIYSVDITGCEARVDVARTGGSFKLYAQTVEG